MGLPRQAGKRWGGALGALSESMDLIFQSRGFQTWDRGDLALLRGASDPPSVSGHRWSPTLLLAFTRAALPSSSVSISLSLLDATEHTHTPITRLVLSKWWWWLLLYFVLVLMPFVFPASSPVFSMILDTQSSLTKLLLVIVSLSSPDPVS